jgi:hypothetical protein
LHIWIGHTSGQAAWLADALLPQGGYAVRNNAKGLPRRCKPEGGGDTFPETAFQKQSEHNLMINMAGNVGFASLQHKAWKQLWPWEAG